MSDKGKNKKKPTTASPTTSQSMIAQRRIDTARLEAGITSSGGGTTTGKRVGLRSYVFHVPNKKKKSAPLLVFFHGSGNFSLLNDWVLSKTSWIDLADREGFFVLFPEAPGDVTDGRRIAGITNVWNIDKPEDDLDFVYHAMEDVMHEHNIDKNRIFAVGFSTGGLFLTTALTEFADQWAACANVMGGYSRRRNTLTLNDCPRTIPVSIWSAPGDPMGPHCEAAMRYFKENGWNPQSIKLPNSDKHTWDKALEQRIWDWLVKNGISLDEGHNSERASPEKSEDEKEPINSSEKKSKKENKEKKSEDKEKKSEDKEKKSEDKEKKSEEEKEKKKEEKKKEEKKKKSKKHNQKSKVK